MNTDAPPRIDETAYPDPIENRLLAALPETEWLSWRSQMERVEMPLGPEELSFYDETMHRIVEPGTFEVMVGGSSADVKKARLEVVAP